MKEMTMRIGLIGLLVAVFVTSATQAWTQEDGVAAVAQGNNAFALDLYGKLKVQEGNLFFSPYSINAAFAMTYAGAKGGTAAQMANAMHFDLPQEKLHPAMKALAVMLNNGAKNGGYEFVIANALWGQEGFGFLPDYLRTTRDNYGASLHEVDFAGNTEAARKTINAWVEDQTQQKIKELLKAGVLDMATTLVLTNAIYFKGKWASPFDKTRTEDAPFTLANGEKLTVPLMNRQRTFAYYSETPFAQIVSLPYARRAFAMVIVLPARADGLKEVEDQFSPASIAAIREKRPLQQVNVFLPRFRVTSEFRLNDGLKALGVIDAFGLPPADFSGMDGKKDLFISVAVHKAYVDVDEEGTTAAAATGIGIAKGEAPPVPPVIFRADHPFLFYIEDTASGTILFMGRVMNPKE
jgi:serine protease inhibitor